MEENPPATALPALLDEWSEPDDEHPDVSLSDDGGATLSVFAGGFVVFENVTSDDPPMHVSGLTRDDVLAMLSALPAGRFVELERFDWLSGYRP